MKWPFPITIKFPSIFPAIPPHLEPREWRASTSLITSILGSVALTAFAAGLVYIMWKGGWDISTAEIRIAILGKALMLSLMGSLVVLITLGFAINRRTIKVNKDGFEASGGDDEDTPAPKITTTTTTSVTVPTPTPTPSPTPDKESEKEKNTDPVQD